MPRRILFVVGQSATVTYLAPLWRRWLDNGAPTSWRVIAAPPAALRIESEGIHGVPLRIIESDALDELEAALFDWTPECVVMSASFAPVESSAVRLARKHRLPLARIIDTWYGYRRRLLNSEGALDLPDRLLVIDEPAATEAVEEGIPARIIEIVGQPAWENVPVLPPADRRDVLFISQPIERFYANNLGYTEKTAWQLLRNAIDTNPDLVRQLYYAPHPEDDMRAPRDSDVIVVKSGIAALSQVGVVVGMFSSLLLDAVLAGKSVVSLQPNAKGPNMCALGRDGMIPIAHDSAELVNLLRSPIKIEIDLTSLAGSCDRLEQFCLKFAESRG